MTEKEALLVEAKELLSEMTAIAEGRTARIVALAWQQNDGNAVNLFTHIRHRRRDALGPWASEPEPSWRCEPLFRGNEDIQLYRLDGPLTFCLELADDILHNSTITINATAVRYDLSHPYRQHWAYHGPRGNDGWWMPSPFKLHSAEVTEFWSFATDTRDRWVEAVADRTPAELHQVSRLGFPLEERPERVGNLMITGAEDAINCSIRSTHTDHIILRVDNADGTPLPIDGYQAIVWADDSGDSMAQQVVPIAENETVIKLNSSVDRTGLAVYRNHDGQCIHLSEYPLIKEIILNMQLSGGPTVSIQDSKRGTTHQVTPQTGKETLSVSGPSNHVRDDQIRQAMLERMKWETGRKARQDLNLARFGPDDIEAAIDYFLSLLDTYANPKEPIYIADPYFMSIKVEDTPERLRSGILAYTKGNSLRIICASSEETLRKRQAWPNRYPQMLTSHVSARSFTRGGGAAFHDRYIITPDKEVIITNSFNGWHRHGVTFTTSQYGVYRAEAEAFWNLNIGDNSDRTHVREIKL